MRRLPALLAISLLALALPVARAAEPSCETLVAALPASLAAADEVVVAVTLEQGGREVAFERSRVTRDAEGNVSTTVLERRGWRRPDTVQGGGGGGGTAELTLPCDDHDLAVTPDGDVELRLRDADPDSPVATWTLRFGRRGERWLPEELVAPFEFRLLFVPVRGRFVTTFEGWAFAGD
jgi:hypothetical protein